MAQQKAQSKSHVTHCMVIANFVSEIFIPSIFCLIYLCVCLIMLEVAYGICLEKLAGGRLNKTWV